MRTDKLRKNQNRSPLTLAVIGFMVTMALALFGTGWGIAFGGTVPDSNSAPSNLQATAVSTTEIDLTFSDNSTDEAAFTVERKIGQKGTYQVIANITGHMTSTGTISYQDTNLTPGTFYFYQVKAVESPSLQSPYSNEAHAFTLSSLIVTKSIDDHTPGSLTYVVNQIDANNKVITFASDITTVQIPSGSAFPAIPLGTSIAATCDTSTGGGPVVTIDVTMANNRNIGLSFGGGGTFHGIVVIGTPLKAFSGGGTLLCDQFRSS